VVALDSTTAFNLLDLEALLRKVRSFVVPNEPERTHELTRGRGVVKVVGLNAFGGPAVLETHQQDAAGEEGQHPAQRTRPEGQTSTESSRAGELAITAGPRSSRHPGASAPPAPRSSAVSGRVDRGRIAAAVYQRGPSSPDDLSRVWRRIHA
jgi:hypothetical protein